MGYVNNVAMNKNRILNHAGLIKKKSEMLNYQVPDLKLLSRAGHIELQLTDQCVLNCPNCHFRRLGDKQFQFEWLDNVVNFIKPRAVTLAGGGEPTIYPRFNEAVLKISEIPHVKIGLITNGVVYPKGQWAKYISWVRISVYSIENGTYSGKSPILLNVVMNNIQQYLCESEIPNVGVHFLFYRKNILETVSFAKNIYLRFKNDKENFKKMHIQFKPAFLMARPTGLTSELHEENIDFLPNGNQVRDVLSVFEREFIEDSEFESFLHGQSNFQIFNQLADGYLDELIEVTNPKNPTYEKDKEMKCYVCLAYQLLDPNGFIYPCFTLAEHRSKEFSIGHVSALPGLDTDQLKKFHSSGSECCNRFFCRNWAQNGVVREYMKDQSEINIPNDYFF